MNQMDLRCDGCGQPSSSEHTARRLQRLEWTTRYRPVHIGTLLLGAVAPQNDSEFIYSPAGGWNGEAKSLLAAAGLVIEGKTAEGTLTEFQRGGLFLTHVLECPLETGGRTDQLIANRFSAVLSRIRRSLKPKRLVPISRGLAPFLPVLNSAGLNCAILLDEEKPFALDGDTVMEVVKRLRDALSAQVASVKGSA